MITPFVNEEQCALIIERLKAHLNKNEDVQVECQIDFYGRENGFPAVCLLYGCNGLAKGNFMEYIRQYIL